jgi:NADPH:quinone reductase
MKAMVATAWTEPAGLQYVDVPDPRPAAGQVAIETRAIGCNFPDVLMVQGKYQVKPPLPFSPGHEVAGVVREVGTGVTRVRPGQRVLGMLSWGGYAEVAVAPAERVFGLPESMSFEDGAAFHFVYQTAYCALVHRAALRAGEWLLVHGAAGGVGLAAVQLGKALGARVIGTAGTEAKRRVARDAGADVVIDYTTEDWVPRVLTATGGGGAAVIYDPVGGTVFDASLDCLGSEGRLLVIGFAGGGIPSVSVDRLVQRNAAVVGVHWGLYQRRAPERIEAWMATLFGLYAQGALRPVISRRYPLGEAPRALAAITSRESYGKVLLIP